MASSHGTPPVFTNKIFAWIDYRLPIFSYIEKEYHTFPTPRNFNYFWNFGAIATVMLVLMIATGIVLVIGTLLTTLLSAHDGWQAFSGVASALNNIGPCYISIPEMAALRPALKVVWMLAMLIGRLEVLPLAVLFSARAWRGIH